MYKFSDSEGTFLNFWVILEITFGYYTQTQILFQAALITPFTQ